MTESALAYHWSLSEFVRAFEAGAFDHRRGDRIPVGYAGVELAVDDLL